MTWPRVASVAFWVVVYICIGLFTYLALKGAGYGVDDMGVGVFIGYGIRCALNEWREWSE